MRARPPVRDQDQDQDQESSQYTFFDQADDFLTAVRYIESIRQRLPPNTQTTVNEPTQFPSVSMVDWNTDAPNARLRVLELLKTNFHPGDRIVKTSSRTGNVYALTMDRKLLLVNKRNRAIDLTRPALAVAVVTMATN